MDKEKTVRFLTETPLSVIACADDTVLQDFLKCLSIEYGKTIAECAVDEIEKADLSRTGIVIVRGIRNGHGKQKLQIAQKLTVIRDIAKACNAHFIVPLEQLDCEPHLVTTQLRGIWLRTPEDEQSEINMFHLHCNVVGSLKLECEFGTNIGLYILYDFNTNMGNACGETGRFLRCESMVKTPIWELKIYLLYRNANMCRAWESAFVNHPNIKIVRDDFCRFMDKHKDEIDCVVSPANSYGLMDGGYDIAITKWFGADLQKRVQQYLLENMYGEQPVGTSIILDTDKYGIKLIHTPIMQTPSRIDDYKTIYHCMRSTLITALNNGVKSVVIPAFGADTGGVPFDIVAQMMWRAYCQIKNPPKIINWDYTRWSSLT